MANIVITAVNGKTYYKLDFGSYSTKFGFSHWFFWKEDIKHVLVDGHVTVIIAASPIDLYLTFDGAGATQQVDSVLTVAPSDNDDLADKIANIKG